MKQPDPILQPIEVYVLGVLLFIGASVLGANLWLLIGGAS